MFLTSTVPNSSLKIFLIIWHQRTPISILPVLSQVSLVTRLVLTRMGMRQATTLCWLSRSTSPHTTTTPWGPWHSLKWTETDRWVLSPPLPGPQLRVPHPPTLITPPPCPAMILVLPWKAFQDRRRCVSLVVAQLKARVKVDNLEPSAVQDFVSLVCCSLST